MHPSRVIRGRKSQLLSGRRIVVGVSGSIAAVEIVRTVRELIRHGAEVVAVMSPEATRLVSPEALAFATGRPPILQLTGDVEHVTEMGPGEGRADLLLLAPATANTLSKVAHGIDDTVVTSFASVALGGGVPVLVAPAMHAHMGRNPAIVENLERLRRWGVGVIAPSAVEGEEKLAAPEEIVAAVLHRLGQPPWPGRKVVVIGGAAREPVDAVRSVTNESSGATAVALAQEAYFRGAEVELWSSRLEVPVPGFLPVRRWSSVADLRSLLQRASRTLAAADLVLVPAALADYTLPKTAGKISSRDHATLTLTLSLAPKVLPELRRRMRSSGRLIGFKLLAGATPAALQEEAGRFLVAERLDGVVANERASMGGDRTEVVLVTPDGGPRRFAGTKAEVAGRLLEELGKALSRLSSPEGPRGSAARSTGGRGGHRRATRRSRGRRRTVAVAT